MRELFPVRVRSRKVAAAQGCMPGRVATAANRSASRASHPSFFSFSPRHPTDWSHTFHFSSISYLSARTNLLCFVRMGYGIKFNMYSRIRVISSPLRFRFTEYEYYSISIAYLSELEGQFIFIHRDVVLTKANFCKSN